MAQNEPSIRGASLLGIPLEIRHMILEFASTREYKPKNVFRKWFEKEDVNEQIAQLQASNPNGAAPIPSHGGEIELDSEDDVSVHSEDEMDHEDEEEQDEGDGEGDDEEQDAEDDEAEQFEAGEDDSMDGNVSDNDADDTVEIPGASVPHPVGTATVVLNASGAAFAGETDGDDEEEDRDVEMGQDGDDGEVEEEGGDGEEHVTGQGHGSADAAGGMVSASDHSAAVRPVVQPHHKWRHVPKFVRITQCPPPTNLLLVCKQLSAEAKDWFYNVAILKIDATASFSHYSFFEMVLGRIAEAAFSPVENIRKAEVTFVWDSTWVRAESTGYAANVFSCFLQDRAEYVLGILQRAPDLQHLAIHWHDTAEDEEAQALMQDILEKFVYKLAAIIDTKVHLIPADVNPDSKSIAGKRRLEFQDIIDHPREAF